MTLKYSAAHYRLNPICLIQMQQILPVHLLMYHKYVLFVCDAVKILQVKSDFSWLVICLLLCRCRERHEQHRVVAVDPGDRKAGGSY